MAGTRIINSEMQQSGPLMCPDYPFFPENDSVFSKTNRVSRTNMPFYDET